MKNFIFCAVLKPEEKTVTTKKGLKNNLGQWDQFFGYTLSI